MYPYCFIKCILGLGKQFSIIVLNYVNVCVCVGAAVGAGVWVLVDTCIFMHVCICEHGCEFVHVYM